MHIHWFPGHMTKALRVMKTEAKLADIFIYVLDARMPGACVNKSFDAVIAGKPVLYVLNKADLADVAKTEQWLKHFKQKGSSAVAVTGSDSSNAKTLLAALNALENKRAEKFESKGATVPRRVMVIGIPNSGKSTVINTLCGRKTAMTGNKPGVTRGKQWVRLSSGLELMDTPGTLYPSFDDQKKAALLAFAGSIKDDILDVNELALELIKELDAQYGLLFREKYGIPAAITSPDETLDCICQKRGYLLKGGEPDRERGARAVLDDFRKARIGRLTLELPE